MTRPVRCQHCTNADPTLLELTDRGDLFCTVCSRVSWAGARMPRAGTASPAWLRTRRPGSVGGFTLSGSASREDA